MRSIPALPVTDIGAAVAFYRGRLGFTSGYHDNHFAIVTRDQIEIHLWAASDDTWKNRGSTMYVHPGVSGAESFIAGTASCRIEVQEIDELYEEYKKSGVL
jgi:catechol 2,3-dioxygenase-like lactoylglutathione lyase family enzyme